MPGGGATHIEVEDEDNESESSASDEEEGDMTPVIKLQSKQKQNPFVKLLLALWPFGESFKQLGVLGKIYEIFKVYRLTECNNACDSEGKCDNSPGGSVVIHLGSSVIIYLIIHLSSEIIHLGGM